MRFGMRVGGLVAAWWLASSCAGGELASTSFEQVDADTGLFGTGDDDGVDPTTSGPDDPSTTSGVDPTTSGADDPTTTPVDDTSTTTGGSDAGDTTDTGEACDREVCNGLDDDCDDDIDEGFEAATCGLGICQVTVETCVEGVPVVCEPLPADPDESCNGLDDDCDGDVDEGCSCTDGDTQPCYSGPSGTEDVGACHGGTQDCTDGAWGDCTGAVVPTGESCNAIDDDCDALTDENNPQGGAQCNTGLVGVCAIGHQQCDAGALGCVADSLGGAEICDGLDNDCDTGIDEGNPGGGGACNTGQQGVCAAGVSQCMNGALQCVQSAQSSLEVCDALDNDCDGSVNEGNPGAGLACSTGFPGQCGPGTTACSGGGIVCNQNAASTAEVCDGVDNDCDAGVDEGNPGGNQFCNTGLLGNCAGGTTACSGGAIACNANAVATPEVCGNNADEDCDGTADDGCGCSHGACTPGGALVAGCSPCVAQICAADDYCCITAWDSVCVSEVLTVCGTYVCPAHQGSCAHSLCASGGALANNCDAAVSNCVAEICAVDPWCCNTSWDAQCVGQVASVCGFDCA